MPGEYRLVVKGHDGDQIGVMTAYESFTYEKLLNRAGTGVLVAHYGVTDAADALLDELAYDIILEVQRRIDGDSEWYVDWMGLCQDTQEEITQAATDKDTWNFVHINHHLERRRVIPPWEGYYPDTGRIYQANRWLETAVVGNAMRNLVREQAVDPCRPTKWNRRRRVPPAWSSERMRRNNTPWRGRGFGTGAAATRCSWGPGAAARPIAASTRPRTATPTPYNATAIWATSSSGFFVFRRGTMAWANACTWEPGD